MNKKSSQYNQHRNTVVRLYIVKPSCLSIFLINKISFIMMIVEPLSPVVIALVTALAVSITAAVVGFLSYRFGSNFYYSNIPTKGENAFSNE